MAGLSVASPKVLRYRTDGEVAEVAWLAPRAREFEVSSGEGSRTRQYGRPGGLFAHGLRLSPEELTSLDNWPAGLLGWGGWVESDGKPTAGQFLEPLELSDALLDSRPRLPRFDAVAPLAERWDHCFLAGLLGASAESVRLGRVLFLLDAPASPGESGGVDELIALLTFAFPLRLRRELTFSTGHDRPEAIPGFRIVGLPATVRPDRAALRALGRVADLAASTLEPAAETPQWADRLATWLIERDESAWRAACIELPRRALDPERLTDRWDDRNLDLLLLFPEQSAREPGVLADPSGRREIRDQIEWATGTALAADWAACHAPAWWRMAIPFAARSGTASEALLRQLSWPESWASGEGANPAEAWGEVVANWFAGRTETEWGEALRVCLSTAPAASRFRFVTAILRHGPDHASRTLQWIAANGGLDPDRLRVLQAIRHLSPAVDRMPLAEVLADALAATARSSSNEGLARLLRSLERELASRPEIARPLGESIALALHKVAGRVALSELDRCRGVALSWALANPCASDLVAPYVRLLIDESDGVRSLARLSDLLPSAARPELIRASLAAAGGDEDRRDAFIGVVETLLVPSWSDGTVPETRWADPYLMALESDLPLLGHFNTPPRVPRLLEWLEVSHKLGELGEAATRRLNRVDSFVKALDARDLEVFNDIELPEVRPRERGWILGQLFAHIGRDSLERTLACLEVCRRGWPSDAFEKSLSVQQRLAEAVAHLTAKPDASLPDFELWRNALVRALDTLQIPPDPDARFGPDGLAAGLVAATARLATLKKQCWKFRRRILLDSDLAPLLATDVRQSFQSLRPDDALKAFQDWDRELEVGTFRHRFLTIFLNACDDSAFLATVRWLANELPGLEPLPWRNSSNVPGSKDDLRDRYARAVPLRPRPFAELAPIMRWLEPDEIQLAHGESFTPAWPALQGRDLKGLSLLGKARWLALEGLSETVSRPWVKWEGILPKVRELPLAALPLDERETVAAWLIHRAEPELADGPVPTQVADALVGLGLPDSRWLLSWFDRISVDGPGDLKTRVKARAEFVAALVDRLRPG